ncbi:DUF1796 family putative cysteine peptidase [Ancylobacter defluvii]|uniref:Uncharacterized protein n=1 Tax=Ancylobacter defluvii TaxID=1282440 RepID=A0A9W6JRP6_9HYPH|nr:DUF1796 family putative cysteine peptidase [Ancylobacter defluvii]MBS7587347.1 hypothetical protein [Ancylobacter defluvii]GLK82037.1 hypothetical protein GCM10017653_01060 [Ancylobacter defluvii]
MWLFSPPVEPLLVVDRIVSLGALCEVAYQTRRLSRTGRAYPFDWWDTPFHGVLTVLETGAAEVFAAANIVKVPTGRGNLSAFCSRLSETIHQHEFSAREDVLAMDAAEIERRLVPKYRALHHRLIADCALGTTLFVRQRSPRYDVEGAALEATLDRLHAALSRFAADPRLLLLDYPPVAPRPWLIAAQVPCYRDRRDLGSRRGWNEVFRTHGIVCRASGEDFGIEDLRASFAGASSLATAIRRAMRKRRALRRGAD